MAKVFQVDTGGTLTTNLQAYYKLEDVTDFWASYDLTNNGTVTFTTGKVNNAANFGASNSTKYLTIADDLGITGGAISMAGWANLTTAPTEGNEQLIVNQGDAGTHVWNYITYRNDGGTFKIEAVRGRNGIVANRASWTATITPGQWNHFAYTYDGTDIILYVNGTNVATVGSSGNGDAGVSDEFSISGQSGAVLWSGLADEVGVWSKELIQQEITDLYNGDDGQTMIDTVSFIPKIMTY